MKDRTRNNMHRGYTMPHKEYMDDENIKYEDLNESLKSRIRLFEDKYDKYRNNDGYLDEQEETELLADSEIIRQEMERWLSKESKDGNGGKVAAGVTLTVLGVFGLLLGIRNLNE